MNRLILASASKSRGDLLRGAGLDITILPADLDENVIKAEGWDVKITAIELAKAKAFCISQLHPEALVIGADQMMACGHQRYDKPVSHDQAREQLQALRGKTHSLYSAVSVYKNRECLWTYIAQADLKMRDFSDAFLEEYLEQIGNDVLTTVGGYRLESLGVQLFDSIEGDYFTILGLPLVALLGFLRTQEILSQ